MAIIKCPHCGQEIKAPALMATSNDLYHHISARLEQYGYVGMCPEKHGRIGAIRNTIKTLVPELPRGNAPIPMDVYERAIDELDRILPDRGVA